MENKLKVAVNNSDKVPDDLKEIISRYEAEIIIKAQRWLERKTKKEQQRQQSEAFLQQILPSIQRQAQRHLERERLIKAGLIVPKKRKPKANK